MPNCISKVKTERRRLFIGDQLDDCKDYSGLFYILPFNKGYLINWEVERQILDFLFKTRLNLTNFSDKSILITEPYFNFKTLQENLIELFFEEFGFGSLFLTNPAHLSALKYIQDKEEGCCLVVDAGYSFVHIVPFIEGKMVKGLNCLFIHHLVNSNLNYHSSVIDYFFFVLCRGNPANRCWR